MFNLLQLDSSVTGWLTLAGVAKEYELLQFNIKIMQTTDHKGQPQSETLGGQMMIKIGELGDPIIYNWMGKPWERRTGSIVFRTNSTSSPMKILFENAYCVNFEETVNSMDKNGARISLVISPEIIFINGVELNQFWTK